MTTLGDMTTALARDLRDTGNATWSVAELQDLINQGIAAVSDIAPREIVQTVGTVATSVYTYDASGFSHIFRVDIHNSSDSYLGDVPSETGGRDSGWTLHGGVLYLPPHWAPAAGNTLRAYGYAGYTQLSSSSSTTDLPSRLQWAVRLYAQVEAFGRLIGDRATFSQWQTNNSDASLLSVMQTYNTIRRRWADEQRTLRRMRKMG